MESVISSDFGTTTAGVAPASNVWVTALSIELRKSAHARRQAERKSGRLVDEAFRLKGKR